MSQKEKIHSVKWAKALLKEIGIWSERIVDTPYMSESGFATYKKPFDRIIVCKGLAVEFKFKAGLSFNLKKWKTDKKTRHQYSNLKKFAESKSGHAILFVFWKQKGKRDIQKRWCYVEQLDVDRIYFKDMRTETELLGLIKEMNDG